MRSLRFEKSAYQDYCQWALVNQKIFSRITELFEDIDRTPFKGIGKPELLRHQYKGYWSRRITKEHRLVYKVSDEYIYIAKCRGHY